MKHPRISAWVDYARAVPDGSDLAAMQRHLDDGCESCAATVAALEKVITTAEIDGAVTPPDGALRSAKAFFAIKHPESRSGWSDLGMRQAFDSLLGPAVAVRSSSPQVRQMLFESDDYTLELSVDYSPGTVDATLRGQILETHGEPRSHTPVFLVGGGEVIGRAISRQQGTFEMSGSVDRTTELWVFPDDENRIRLSLEPGR